MKSKQERMKKGKKFVKIMGKKYSKEWKRGWKEREKQQRKI